MLKRRKYWSSQFLLIVFVVELVILTTTPLAWSRQASRPMSATKIAEYYQHNSSEEQCENQNDWSTQTGEHEDEHEQDGGKVLPPKAKPKGYSLQELAKLIAPFQDTVNPDLLPKNIPFQILYIPTPTSTSNSFTVPEGTLFYVPMFSANDSPPILGKFPTNRKEALFYAFDPSQLGANNIKIIVDGKATLLCPQYLAGPVTQELPNGGTHSIVFAVFLSPLSLGTHTVELQNNFNGALLGGTPISTKVVYTIQVVPREKDEKKKDHN
jgi:hypothetical protein